MSAAPSPAGPRSAELEAAVGGLVADPDATAAALARVPDVPSTGPPLRRLSASLRPVRGRLLVATVLAAAATGCAIALLGTSGWLISRASQLPNIVVLQLAIVGVRAFGIGRGVARYGERLTSHDAVLRGLTGLRVAVFRRLARLAPAGLAPFGRGDLLARLVADVDATQDEALRVRLPRRAGLLAGAGSVAVLWWLLPAAGLVLLVALLVGATLVPAVAAGVAGRQERQAAGDRAELTDGVVALLEGAPDLIACGAGDAAVDRLLATDRRLTAAARRTATTTGLTDGLGVLLSGLAVLAAVLVGVPAVQAGRLDGVDLAVVVLVPLAAYEAVVGLPAAALARRRAQASATRVVDVLDAPVPVTEPPAGPVPVTEPAAGPVPVTEPAAGTAQAGDDARRAPAGGHRLAVRGLVARWPGSRRAAVAGVDLDLPVGSRVALTGTSGAGKSTLVAVLLRFLDYDGSVTLDGAELRDLPGDEVRSVVGLCAQDAHVFDRTLGDNLRVAAPDATDDELGAVLARVGLGPWLASLPDGLDTWVGEHGSRLSGGQRQRAALARVLLADRPVLLLDEPTEHLDPVAAGELTRDLLAVSQGRTVLLVTHRLFGLEDVDEVLVMEAGRVVERGTHAALLAAGGRYAERWTAEQATAALLPG